MNIEKNIFKTFLMLIAKIMMILLLFAVSIYFWPFTLAIFTAMCLEPLIRKIMDKTKFKRKYIGLILVVIVYAILISIIFLLVYKLITELSSLSSKLPEIYDKISYFMDKIYLEVMKILNKFPQEVTVKIYEVGRNVLNRGMNFLYVLLNKSLSIITFLPSLLVYVVVNFLATIFLVVDRNKITTFLKEKINAKYLNKLFNFIKESSKTFLTFLKAQSLLLLITFLELLIAFIIIKQPYPIVLALIIALVDALPILGTGTVLLPWSIFLSFNGKINISIFLIITYLTIIIVRQLIEPKIVSKAIGVHPLVTLLCMYICFKVFGLIGLFIGSILAALLKNILVNEG